MTGDGGAMQAPADDKQLEKGLKDKTQSSGPGLWPFIIVSSSYLLYTITDGAIRMVVLLHAYEKGFSAMEVAIMFTLYEVAGVVTNLLAGIAGSRWGLRTTLLVGLSLQLVGISSLFGWEDEWGKLEAIIFVTFSQMLCGIAKDLTKLGGKTVAKLVTPDEKQSSLFRLVSFITGMKNSLKGAGYFLGAATVSVSYSMALGILLGLIALSIPGPIFGLSDQLGRTGKKVTLKDAFQMNYNINVLSASRMFLFGSRDAWFEVPLPFFLRNAEVGLNWSRPLTGTFLAVFIILYGQIQSWCPQIVLEPLGQAPANKFVAMLWAGILLLVPLGLGPTILTSDPFQEHDTGAMSAIMITFIVAFCAIFAVNSAVHSYLVLRYAEGNKVAVNVGFYYMSNAAGRLIGTILSGVLYSYAGSDRAEGFGWCFVLSAGFVLLCTLITAGIKDDDAGLMCGPLVCVGKLPDSSSKLEAALEAPNPGNALLESAGAAKEKAKLQTDTDGVAVDQTSSKEAAAVSEGSEEAMKLPGPPGLLSAPQVEQSMSRGEAQADIDSQGAEKSAVVDV